MNPVIIACALLMIAPLDNLYSEKEAISVKRNFEERMIDNVNFQNYVQTMSKDLLEGAQLFIGDDYIPTYSMNEYLELDTIDIE